MSANRLEMQGLDELRAALRDLPENLRDEATAIIRDTAVGAKDEIVGHYPEGPTGNLKAGVTVEINSSKFGTSALVRSRAKHAWIFEYGTKSRRTAKGANRGTMPKAPDAEAMIPVVVRRRARMYERLKDLLRTHGFEVSA